LSAIFQAQNEIYPSASWDISISKVLFIVSPNCNKRGVISFIPDWILNLEEDQHILFDSQKYKVKSV
jgi:hypothetical protein